MLRLMNDSAKNQHWSAWELTNDPFLAFRAEGQCHRAFLAVARDYTPWFPTRRQPEFSDDSCAVVKTQKGGWLLVPRGRAQDERIALITASSAYRGWFSDEQVFGGEILWKKSSSKHCYEVRHYVVRFTDDDGYLALETGKGNRCGHGLTMVFSWRGGYFHLPTEEYQVATEQGNLFAEHDTISDEIAACQRQRQAEKASRADRMHFLPRLKKVNTILQDCGKSGYVLGETFFTEESAYAGLVQDFLYTEKNVEKAEERAQSALAYKAEREACDFWEPQFRAATAGYGFTEGLDPWGQSSPEYLGNCVHVWSVAKDKFVRYDHSAEGLAQFVADLPEYEEEYLSKQRVQAKAEAERIAREKAEEAERLAREAAQAEQAKLEEQAAAAGLPSDIRIWKRTSGRTGCSKGYVIRANGTCRERDALYNANSNRARRYDEGYEIWNQICAGELVLQWSKDCTAAEHELEVIHRPEVITEAQLEAIAEILDEINEEWKSTAGLTSGKASPLIDVQAFLAQLTA